MMSNSTSDESVHKTSLLKQSKERLIAFFQQPLVKRSVNILVPGILAAAFFPIFGPAVVAPAAAVAIQQGLKALGISFSDETTKALIKPLEGKELDEDALLGVLEEILPKDKKVNEEMAKALVIVAPTIKEAALTNSRLDTQWLSKSMETNLTEQGEMMAKIASKVGDLLLKDGAELEVSKNRLLQDWSRISVEVTASEDSEVSGIKSKAKTAGGDIDHRVAADKQSKIWDVEIDSDIT